MTGDALVSTARFACRIGSPHRPHNRANFEIPTGVVSWGVLFSSPALRTWLRVKGVGLAEKEKPEIHSAHEYRSQHDRKSKLEKLPE